ncbi:MAG: hypothetical protein GVY15_09710 [Bacteroidetes bacterium]|jgi:hypothetical protein|nr:hypothetical protein [Bacteroidota bacterium]
MNEPWIVFERVGQYDRAEDIRIGSDGRYEVQDGTYVSRGLRRGTLPEKKRRALMQAIDQLPPDPAPPIPAQAEGFVGHLSIRDETGARTITFWGPVPDLPGPLRHFLALLRQVE